MDTLGFNWTPDTSFPLFLMQPLPPKLLLMLWLLLTLPVRSLDVPEGQHADQGSLPSSAPLRQLQCYCMRPKGHMNCTWEPSLDPGIPYNFYYQSLKYHPNRIQNVTVPKGQSWIIVERERLTVSDRYLVWLSPKDNASQPGDPEPLSLYLDSIVKPEPPKLSHEVEFSDDPTVVTVTVIAPAWPPHENFKYQLRFRDISASVWQYVEPRDLLTSSFLELPGLEPATVYEVSSRSQLQNNMGFWSDWSATLKFQSLPAGKSFPLLGLRDPSAGHSCVSTISSLLPSDWRSSSLHPSLSLCFCLAPTGQVDVWVFGLPCSGPHPQEESYVLLWKDLMPGLGLSYKVVFQVPGGDLHLMVIPCCSTLLPKDTEWVSIVAFNITGQRHPSNLTLACSGSAPKQVQVHSMGNQGMLVTWLAEPQEHQEFIVEWTKEETSFQELNWTHVPNGSHSTLLRAPLEGPVLWQIPSAASGALTVAWAELPRGQRGGHFTHYTLYVQPDSGRLTLLNVSADTLNVTLWDLPGGYYKMWVTASTIAGPGQPGQLLQLFLPEKNWKEWKMLWNVLLFCVLLSMSCCLGLVFSKCCLCQKFLPHWVSERIPDPSNSKSMQPWGEEVPQAPPPKDALFLDVEEVETPMSAPPQPPEAPIPFDSGYEKHFLPTPEELGLLTLPRQQNFT
ncbi:interleukin-27 receptor subunit alpha isoform X3 [Vombatus ursinus]|uniref:interleukin-27 receptor subunit alpha isoform X3 n=1 Tax=Vombatus ursinus TaxID=29139 RepID=UPI000FFD7A01|nr:interleukin-27 receptor subunit alpha isoform X3 [Vombatus ursinus]